MTYPPQPGGYDPYGQQQPGFSPQQPVTGVPSSPAGGYGPPAYQQPGYGPPVGGQVPEPGDRPGLVTTAAMLMVAMTVISLLMGGLIIFYSIEDANSSATTDVATTGRTVSVVIGIFFLIIGLGVIALALAVLRGHNWARITTWSAYGIFALFFLCGLLVSFGVLSDTNSGSDTTGGVIVILGIALSLVIQGVTVALLAAPAANQWFKAVGLAKRAGVI